MAIKINSCCVIGFDCHLVEIEVEIVNGLSSFEIVGLGDTAIQEAKQRVYSAIKNTGAEFPRRRKIVNLAPADLKKHGPLFDLPMALGLLIASGQIPPDDFTESLVIGELALSGHVRPVKGVLPITSFAQTQGFRKIFVPEANVKEASLVPNIEIFKIQHLSEILTKTFQKVSYYAPFTDNNSDSHGIMIHEIRGHEFAKRALMIAAAGSHNLLMNGPPGSGKTMLAKALSSILPILSFEESIEVTKIYSLNGKLSHKNPLVIQRPFRSVHHTISTAALVGGGSIPHPGEISLAHRGILFLDELPEFPRSVLEVLRQPLEDGTITVSRASYRTTFPSRFMFVASMNPCPCGFATDPKKSCACSPSQLRQYFKKLSGPLLDRIDLFIHVPRLEIQKLEQPVSPETTKELCEKIEHARQIQLKRFHGKNIFTNSEMSSKDTQRFCTTSTQARDMLRQAMLSLQLSGRSYFRILKVSRTIADLENSDHIETHHLAEALQYRKNV